MIKLKPCPFCGGNGLLKHDDTGIGASYIQCEKCGVQPVRFIKSFQVASDDLAAKFWNTRYDNG